MTLASVKLRSPSVSLRTASLVSAETVGPCAAFSNSVIFANASFQESVPKLVALRPSAVAAFFTSAP